MKLKELKKSKFVWIIYNYSTVLQVKPFTNGIYWYYALDDKPTRIYQSREDDTFYCFTTQLEALLELKSYLEEKLNDVQIDINYLTK